ncbi:MAG TPA: D-2-hydroxyacid dehydrogenase [Verrucomicrobiae bacterium]|jgi:glycerate dehydrogenase|nr:D-2-hydroxyacid dehydrogenase [Verrucomicrobiae bacterium]
MNIIALDGYTLNPGDNPWDEVAKLGAFTCFDRTPVNQIVERACDAEIILTNKTLLSAATIGQLPKLKFIAVTATGYNIVDVQAARERGIPVANVPIYATDTVAEYVMAFLLNFYCQPHLHSELVKQGEWSRSGDFCFWRTPLAELSGKTIGIVGFGRIGQRVGELATAFRMRVLANSRTRSQQPPYSVEWREIPELFAESDVVTLHCPLTPENTGMVNEALLGRMKKTAYLVNTARGALINERDLAAALQQGRIAGAALDVVSKEPIAADNPLLKAPNVTLTPHIGWAAIEARRRLMRATAQNIAAFLAGKPINVVNRF